MGEKRSNKRLWLGLGATFVVLLMVGVSIRWCVPAWLQYGLVARHCPDGTPVQTLSMQTDGLRRGSAGAEVRVHVIAHYTTSRSDAHYSGYLSSFTPTLRLLDKAGEDQGLELQTEWKDRGDGRGARVKIPEIPDGEYTLEAKVKTRLGESTMKLDLPFFAPARVHVLTDRPLYEPGDTVHFRSLIVRANDLAPLDGRPGKWMVESPNGDVLLEESSPAGLYGVASSSFPLDGEAPSGTWRVRWQSGDASGVHSFRVEPFTLPRFSIDVQADRTFYGVAATPKIRGRVTYTSGAPVADAAVALRWNISGRWPMPTRWNEAGEGGLPTSATTDASGEFTLSLPRVPGDLVGQATLAAHVSAIDPAGDRATGSVSILLSKDTIKADAISEFGGLVDAVNNRVYLRVTRADGAVLAKTSVRVKRAWDPTDEGQKTTTDEDGVAAVQLDPGPPVNVVVPALPYRAPPKQASIRRDEVLDVISMSAAPLADLRLLDEWAGTFESCAKMVGDSDQDAEIGARVAASGSILATVGGADGLSRCLESLVRSKRFSVGKERLYRIRFSAEPPDLPRLTGSLEGTPTYPEGLAEWVTERGLAARECLPDTIRSGAWPHALVWRVERGQTRAQLSWTARAGTRAVAPNILRCVERQFTGFTLKAPMPMAAIGVVHFEASPSPRTERERPQATTRLGYELRVEAHAGEEEIGKTTLIMPPGQVPALRMRVEPVLAMPGETVRLTLIRGPGFQGEFPEHLYLRYPNGSIKGELDKATRTAEFKLPSNASGWFEASWSDARALVFVPEQSQLAVHIHPDKTRYKPRETARLTIQTEQGGRPAPAGVGLFGVDETLGQLASLPGVDALESLRPRVETPSPPFGVLSGQALSMGRIQGHNARLATVLRVTNIPAPEALDVSVRRSDAQGFDPVVALTDHFYGVLAEVHAQTRAWEESAPDGAHMTPKMMAKIWSAAIDACSKRGEPVTDAYGRKMRLHHLPSDLLALVAPRAVVIDGTRLPEDVEDWDRYVREVRP